MTAAMVVKALGGRRGLARCPAHDDKTPSLSVTDALDGRLLTHCFSGCSPEAVWDALKRKGLVGDDRAPRLAPRRPQADNSAHALSIWQFLRHRTVRYGCSISNDVPPDPPGGRRAAAQGHPLLR